MPRLCLLLYLSIMLAWPLSAEADDQSDAGIAYFEKHVRPLLIAHCYECHSTRAKKQSGGLLLDSRAGWTKGGESGPAIAAGNPEASLLIRAVRYQDDDLQMPPEKRLGKQQVARLVAWVKMGAPAPRNLRKPGNKLAKASDPAAGKSHWAFRPLANPRLPAIRQTQWPRTPLDRFVLAELEKQNLKPSRDADRRVLMRRLYLQLTGLPPTRRQRKAFLHDSRPDAERRLVERLLNSPQFGERWGRHWLDLARYADSNGLDENFLFRQAWRYRNWVIDAVNADAPYDRFLREQIAGDLLPYQSITQRDRQRIGTGFLVVGPKVLLGVGGVQQRMEVADEQIDTVGRAILAQTLGCARCHDHKFDPIPTADYYALAGIMTSTEVMEKRKMLGSIRHMEQLVGLGKDGERLDAAFEKYWAELPAIKANIKDAQAALELLKKGDDKKLADLIAKKKAALAPQARGSELTKQIRIEKQKAFIARLATSIARQPAKPPRAMVASDKAKPRDEHIRLSGQPARLGKLVPRGFLQVLRKSSSEKIAAKESGRLALARWLTDVDHGAGELSARVLANRVWHHLMGHGLVRTVDNFGRRGESPSHPELLDYLARRLIESGWSIKALVREIVLSRTFAMSSEHNLAAHQLDPENRFLWRANRRRLAPEALRDNLLAIAGQLDLARMDSSVWYLGDQATGVGLNKRRRTDFPNRSVYLPVIRNDLPELFEVFDFADPHITTGARPRTAVATQGLYLLNDKQMQDASEVIARRLLKDDSLTTAADRVERAFDAILFSRPTNEERQQLEAFVRGTQQILTKNGNPTPALEAWTMVCHALFASSRFQFVE